MVNLRCHLVQWLCHGDWSIQAVRASHLLDPKMTRHGNLHTSTDSTGYTVAQDPSARVEILDRAKKAN